MTALPPRSMARSTVPPAPPTEIVASPAVEFLMMLASVSDGGVARTLDVGPQWWAELVRRAGPHLMRSTRHLTGGCRDPWLELLPLVADSSVDHDVASLVEHLRSADPTDLCQRMAGYYDAEGPGAAAGPRTAANGDPGANPSANRLTSSAFLRLWCSVGPMTLHRDIAGAVQQWASKVWPAVADEVMPVLARGADALRGAADATSVDDAWQCSVEGYMLPNPTTGQTLILAPTYIGRPWLMVGADARAIVVAYPLGDAAMSPASLPLLRLLRLQRAFESTLRGPVVRELARGAATPTELAARLGVGVDVVRRELLALRVAGWATVSGDTHAFTLRPSRLDGFGQLLSAAHGPLS